MKRLAVIGASYLQLPLVLKAKNMGIETHCFAIEEGAVCKDVADFFYPISIVEKDEILEKCREINIDGIYSIASDVAVPTISYVADKLGLIANSNECALKSTNKYEMRKALDTAMLNSPKYILHTDINNFTELNYPLIVKPTDRSGSLGVEKVYSENELKRAITFAKEKSLSQGVIIEEFVSGVEVSVEAVSWQGEHHILSITDKETTGEPHFVELAHHQPSGLYSEMQDKIKAETIKALDAVGAEYGASHNEFIITEDNKLFVVEVGTRMGGDFIGSDLVYLSTGYDFLKGVIDISLGEFEKPILERNKYSGVYFLSRETEYIKEYLVSKNKKHWHYKSEITNNQLINVTCSADRSGYLIYNSNKKIILK